MIINIIVLLNRHLINYLYCIKLAECENIEVNIKNTAYEIAERIKLY